MGGACASKPAVQEAPADVTDSEFVPANNIEFPDLGTLRKELSEKEKERRASALAKLKTEKGVLIDEDLLEEEEYDDDENEGRVNFEEDEMVHRLVDKFERGDAEHAAKEKEIERMKSWKMELEQAKEERLRTLQAEEPGEGEYETVEAIDELELVEETVDDEGMGETTIVQTAKIEGLTRQLQGQEAPLPTGEHVELDEETKKKIRKRRKDLYKHRKELPTDTVGAGDGGKAAPRQTVEEFEVLVEDFLMRGDDPEVKETVEGSLQVEPGAVAVSTSGQDTTSAGVTT